MPMMSSAVLLGPHDIRLEEIPRPEIDDPGDVLLKVEGHGICGSNLHWWYGGGPATGMLVYPMPGAGGHEFAGVVAEVGRDVTRVRAGDRVAVDQFESMSCGSCPDCAGGLFTQCERRKVLRPDGFVEYLKLTEKGLYRLPEKIETHAAAVVQPYACAVSGVRRANPRGGERVIVLGAGVLGLCAAGAAKALGAERVVITAKYESQAALAGRFGADVVIDSAAEDLVGRLLAAVGGRGADLVVETVGGHAPTLSQALEVVRPAGTIVVLGLWDDLVPVDSWKSVLKDATYVFALNHGVIGRHADYELCLEWMASGRVPAQDLVTHVMPMRDIAEAFRLAADKTRGAIKVVLRP